MGRLGMQCCAYGCSKRKKKTGEQQRSDSEGSPDEETATKKQYPRTFHRYTYLFSIIAKVARKVEQFNCYSNRKFWIFS